MLIHVDLGVILHLVIEKSCLTRPCCKLTEFYLTPLPLDSQLPSNSSCTVRLQAFSPLATWRNLHFTHSELFTISFTGSLNYFELLCTSLFISCLPDSWRKVPFVAHLAAYK